MPDEVLGFINKRWKCNSNWLDGNCLWFAFILSKRFENAEIYYLPIEGHFIAKINNKFYDWSGEVTPKEKIFTLDEIKNIDSIWYNRIIRDCFY